MKSLQRMVYFMQPYRWVLLLGFVTVILPVSMELIVPRALQVVIDQGIMVTDMQAIIQGSMLMLGAALVGSLATLGQGFCRAQISQGVAFDMRNELFTHTQSLSFGNLDQMQTGRLMTRLSSDVDMVRLFASAGLALLLRAALMISGSVVMMFLTDWRLSLIMLVLLPVAGAIIWSVMRAARPLFSLVQQKLGALNTIVQENLAGARVVKAYVREQFEITRFEEYNIDYREQSIRVGRLIAIALPLLVLLTNLGIVAVIWLGGMDVINGRLSVGELVAFNSYLMIGMAPLLMLGNVLTMVSRAEASAERVFEVLDTEPLIQSAPSPHTAPAVKGRVEFVNVSFRYNSNGYSRTNDDQFDDGHHRADGPRPVDGSKEVLRNVSFKVEPGQQIALLGATGSGKSTLVNLIPRFYDITGGQLRIDGVDVRDWPPDVLRSQIGIALQQTTLFSGSIRDNIAYGRPDAPPAEVEAAARAAQAHDFIMAMPAGYGSPVEARGANLSGGQRQRIAIARALLISPGILILDDSTSAVDMETEYKIQQALAELMAGRTTFIIAQRINSVLNADQIIVLDSGRIVACGTHHQLLQSSPMYQEIYRSQFGEKGLVEATSPVSSDRAESKWRTLDDKSTHN